MCRKSPSGSKTDDCNYIIKVINLNERNRDYKEYSQHPGCLTRLDAALQEIEIASQMSDMDIGPKIYEVAYRYSK